MSLLQANVRGSLCAQAASSRRSMGKPHSRCTHAFDFSPICKATGLVGTGLPHTGTVCKIWRISGEPLTATGLTGMDRLQQLVETLRVLARANEPNRVVLIEEAIDEYLSDKVGIVRLSLERLCNAIDREEAEKRSLEDWSIAKNYIHSRLQRLA